MIAIDGKEYQHDTWYPLPFVFEGRQMLPFRLESVEVGFLFLRLGTAEWPWSPWNCRRGATEWCVRLEGWYEI